MVASPAQCQGKAGLSAQERRPRADRSGAVSLRVGRLRVAAAATVLAIGLAIYALWPAPRGGIVLYTNSETGVLLAQAFEHKSGIPITVVELSTGPMLARIAAEAKRPRWSMAWVDGDLSAAALDQAGLLEHNMIPDARWTALGRSLLPANGAWVPTGTTLAGVQLTRPGQTGPIGMPDPAISGPAFPEVAGLLWQGGGWPQGQGVLRRMRASGLRVSPTNPAVVAELNAGHIGTALVQSASAYALAHRDPDVRIAVPKPVFLMPGVLMVAKGLPDAKRTQAQQFIAFVLSSEAHAMRLASSATDRFYWPLIEGRGTLPDLPPLGALPIVHLDPYLWAARQAEITDWLEARIARQ